MFPLRLSCRKVEQMWFDLMMSYGDLGYFLRHGTTTTTGGVLCICRRIHSISRCSLIEKIFKREKERGNHYYRQIFLG
jgi:hypothetical protein